MIQAQITISIETSEASFIDILELLELQLPYMAENVAISSETAPIKGEE